MKVGLKNGVCLRVLKEEFKLKQTFQLNYFFFDFAQCRSSSHKSLREIPLPLLIKVTFIAYFFIVFIHHLNGRICTMHLAINRLRYCNFVIQGYLH